MVLWMDVLKPKLNHFVPVIEARGKHRVYNDDTPILDKFLFCSLEKWPKSITAYFGYGIQGYFVESGIFFPQFPDEGPLLPYLGLLVSLGFASGLGLTARPEVALGMKVKTEGPIIDIDLLRAGVVATLPEEFAVGHHIEDKYLSRSFMMSLGSGARLSW